MRSGSTKGPVRAGWFGRGRTRALLCLAAIAALAVGTSTAHWTDDVEVSGAAFTSGTLDLVVNDADPYTGATELGISQMVPGNTSAHLLTVKNAGTVPAKYTLTGGLTGAGAALYAAEGARGLRLTIRLGGTVSGTGSARTCTGGTEVHSLTALTATTTTSILGKRPSTSLAPGASETLCFEVRFASDAPDSLQGKSADAVFTVTGTSDVS